jgi:ribosomal protein S18 acetylase RimI-like enzyme
MAFMAADKLIPVRFVKGDFERPDVQAFRCGSLPHETPLADWIKTRSVEALSRGTKIWLYEREDEGGQHQLVGYGSLSKCKIEMTEEDNSTHKIKVLEIPMLAVHEDFRGCPKDIADKEAKYSRQIVRHLQQMAREDLQRGQDLQPLLTLYVHPAAIPAQNLYTACGFVAIDRSFHDKTTGADLQGMVFKLK